MRGPSPLARYGMRGLALFYLAALLVIPLGMIFFRTFEDGLQGPIDAITSSDGVIGLSLFLIYGRDGLFGGPLADAGIQIIFSTPGLVLATVFVSLPFVVREVMPVLQEIGTDQEQAAQTLGASPWQTFWRVTLPSIRWGVTYGVVLATARALGEFGAVSVVSGKISGQTETLPLFVENEYTNFNLAGAYAAAIVLAILALTVLFSMNYLQRRSRKSEAADDDADVTPGTGVFVPHPIEKEA